MGKKISNPDNTQVEKKKSESDNLSSKLFESREITLSISPITILSLFILLTSLVYSWDKYRQQAICEVINENEDKIQWISVPDHSNSKSYLSLDNGAFVYRHIYMDEFEKEFNVKPIHFSIIDPDIADYIAKHNLRSKLLNYTDQEVASAMLQVGEEWSPFIEKIEYEVGNGTYVDDRHVYIRWTNDIVRWGMFANRNFEANEFLGIYTGYITRQLEDVDYAWEFNYLVDVLDDDGEKVRVCIDAKNMGNYMRFANHLDSNHNGDQVYVIHGNMWYVVYTTKQEIKAHEQIFVNYGEAYWEHKQKFDF